MLKKIYTHKNHWGIEGRILSNYFFFNQLVTFTLTFYTFKTSLNTKYKLKIFSVIKTCFHLWCPPYLITLCKEHLQAANMHHTFSIPNTFSSTILPPMIYSEDHYKVQEGNITRKPPVTCITLNFLFSHSPPQTVWS